MVADIGFEHAVLNEYYKKGLFCRRGLAVTFLKDMKNQISLLNTGKDQDTGLSGNQVIATLQLGAISHIMMLIEDLGAICLAINKNTIDYYQFLDKSGDEDLGRILGEFYNGIMSTSDDILRKILGYVDPQKYEFKTEEDKEFVKSLIQKNLAITRRFFGKVVLFRENHIKIFRRYKHAGFPFFLGIAIDPSDIDLQKFAFTSFALTSRNDIGSELTMFPFSEKVIESYHNLIDDIVLFLSSILNSKLISTERKSEGVLPSYMDHFTKNFTSDEIKRLTNLWAQFEEKYPTPTGKIEYESQPKAEYTLWYTDIEGCSKAIFLKE